MTTEQSDTDGASVVALRVGSHLIQRSAGDDVAIAVDEVVIPDVLPPAVLDVPAADLRNLEFETRVLHPLGPGGRAMHDDLVDMPHVSLR
jgi:hypothetical protein